jgi:hypothetical protein
MTFLEASKIVLENNLNDPMTASEIWDVIIEMGLITEYGRTPKLSLNTILHRSDLFTTIVDKPADKFIYKRYVSKNVKESLIENGFITEERLYEILKDKLGK